VFKSTKKTLKKGKGGFFFKKEMHRVETESSTVGVGLVPHVTPLVNSVAKKGLEAIRLDRSRYWREKIQVTRTKRETKTSTGPSSRKELEKNKPPKKPITSPWGCGWKHKKVLHLPQGPKCLGEGGKGPPRSLRSQTPRGEKKIRGRRKKKCNSFGGRSDTVGDDSLKRGRYGTWN